MHGERRCVVGLSVYLVSAVLQSTMTGSAYPPFRDHAPALLSLPTIVALAIVSVCGARALQRRSDGELLGLRAEGACATVLSWVLAVAALAVAYRALW